MVDKRSSEGIRSKKKMRDEGEDGGGGGGINRLPDSLLHHVLSFLTMEEAVQTSLVSKRWRCLWTSLPTLNFTRGKEYMEYVDSVLILRDSSCNIQRFSITDSDYAPYCRSSFVIDGEAYSSDSDSDSDEESESDNDSDSDYNYPAKKPNLRLNIWILTAIRRNVEEIHLEIYFGESSVKLPHCLFTCKSLRKLELISLDSNKPRELILPDSISLPRLQILHLEGLTLQNEGDFKINDFLSNCCPVVESLTLNECGIQAKNINIVAHNLKHLVINENFCKKQFMKHGGATGSFRLYAPNLISFHCKDYLSKSYCLENLSSLVEAHIDMKVRAQEKLNARILEKGRNVMIRGEKMINFGILHNVKHLKLSAWALQIVIATYELDSASTEFHNLKSLKLQTWLSRDCIGGITWLLNISPNIVKLSVEIIQDTIMPIFTHWNERKLYPTYMSDNGKWPLQCVLDHLKIVEIRGLKGLLNELKFLEVLLKNAVVLEKLIMFFSIDSQKTKDARERQLIEYRGTCNFSFRQKLFEQHHVLENGMCQGSVRVFAPKLISFHCKDYLLKRYCLENLSSLDEAYIDMKVRAQEKRKAKIWAYGRNAIIHGVKMDLRGLRNVKHLKLSAWALQIFIATYGSSDSASTEFHNLRSLKLQTWLSGECICGIARLLNISPNIVKLSLEVIADTVRPVLPPQWDEIKLSPADIGGEPLQCMLDHLKIVEIRGLQGRLNELKFLEVLLKNAMVLEKLIMVFDSFNQKSLSHREKQLIEYRVQETEHQQVGRFKGVQLTQVELLHVS